MKKEVTAEYMHQLLKKEVFKDVDLSKVEEMSDDERRKFTIAEADSLLRQRPYGDSLDWYIGQFLNDDHTHREDNPLYQEQSVLKDWYLELADFGFNLTTHAPFDLNYLEPGLGEHPDEPEQDITPANHQLTEWIQKTPYRRVAMLVARILLEREYKRVIDCFDAVQDYYAENCTSNRIDTEDEAECESFISSVLACINTVVEHQQRGRALGLNDDEMRVVDALWGWMPHDYDEDYVAAAKEVCQAVEASLPSPTVIRSRNGFTLYKEPVIKQLQEIVNRHDLNIDLTDHYNITIGYLSEWLFKKYRGKELNNDDALDGYREF